MKSKPIFLALLSLTTLIFLIMQSCTKNEEKTNQPPTCIITAPTNGMEILKRESVTISMEANDTDGNITEVRFFVDGVNRGSVSNYPYNYIWTTDSESIGNHIIKATAIDNSGNNTSDEISVDIIEEGGSNTPPTALFTVSPSSGFTSTVFAFDASDCKDDSTSIYLLQVRWDFDGNGTWDTDWKTNKVEIYKYVSESNYTAQLEVRDTEGLISEYNISIIVANGGISSFMDPRDSQSYSIVEIGSQTWFAENLNYTTSHSWAFDLDPVNGDIYGRLYTWEAALTACPNGWHLPSDDEWATLAYTLGPVLVVGGKMKETGTEHWKSPNTGATNSSGFTALPGGTTSGNLSFALLGFGGYWWTATEYSNSFAWRRFLHNSSSQLMEGDGLKTSGLSVRCIKD